MWGGGLPEFFLSSSLLPKNINTEILRTIVWTDVTCGFKCWGLVLKRSARQRVLKIGMLRENTQGE